MRWPWSKNPNKNTDTTLAEKKLIEAADGLDTTSKELQELVNVMRKSISDPGEATP